MDPHKFLCASYVPQEPQCEQDQPGYTWILRVSDIPQEPQSEQDQPGYTWILMSFCVLQMYLKSHNLNRPTWIHMDPPGFLCASDVPDEPQSEQDQPGYTWFLMTFCVLLVSLKSLNLDRTNVDTGDSSYVPVCFKRPWRAQSGQDQLGYTWFLMTFCVLQVSLKSHNLDRTNLDTGGYHVFLCASGVSEKPQSG